MQQTKNAPMNTQGLAEKQGMHKEGAYPVQNEDYNIIVCLSNELQGLEAMLKYEKDDTEGGRFWKDAIALKKQLAELFTHELAEHAREGAFGSGEHRFSGKQS